MLVFNDGNIGSMYNIDDDNKINLLEKAYIFNYKHKTSDILLDISKETAMILAIDFHADINTIVASLIYRGASRLSSKQIKELFNDEIMYKVNLLNKFNSNVLESDNMDREVMINMILIDVKVCIIKLVERISILHHIDMDNISRYGNFLIDTLNFYVPVAQLFGIYKIKNNLEDLCFRYDDNYEVTNELVQRVIEKYNEIIPFIKDSFKDSAIDFKDDVMFKNNRRSNYDIYSKVNKMREKVSMLNNDEKLKISGFCSIKCLTKTRQECYSMLCFLHQFRYLLGSFVDYMNLQNDEYKALHTSIFVNNYLVDVHVCTENMDRVNYYGITSNWESDSNLQYRLMNNYKFYKMLEVLVGQSSNLISDFQKQIVDEFLDVNKCISLQKIKK